MTWVIGAGGMLGHEVTAELGRSGMPWVGTDREVDIRDPEALEAFGRGRAVTGIVNCAAYTAVDAAEDAEEKARELNATGAQMVACVASRIEACLIHISTDYVFDGSARAPYTEADIPHPMGAYGRTKAEGETLVASSCRRHFIVRTAWLYGKHGGNFVTTMLRLMKERTSLGVVADQRGSPTWARDLAVAIRTILVSGSKGYGIYHFTNEGEISWYQFALEIHAIGRSLGLLNHDVQVRPLSTEEYPTRAARPRYSVLSKTKFSREFGQGPPHWSDSLRAYLSEVQTA